MRITIESTDKLTTIDGVPVRCWNGTTEGGIPCYVFVHRIVVHRAADCFPFHVELAEQAPPAEVALASILEDPPPGGR